MEQTIDEANSQIRAANGNKLQWVFSDEKAGEYMRNYLKDNGVDVDKIEFKHMEEPTN